MSTLLTACTLDGSSKIVPLTFSIIDLENDLSWSWFFNNLKAVFREPNDLVILFDAHKSIANGFSSVYHIRDHGLCAFHLYDYSCVGAYTTFKFEWYMRKLDNISPSIRHELEKIGKTNAGLGLFFKGNILINDN